MEENAQSKLPPLPEEAFDGEKHSVTLEFPKCKHELILIKSQEVKCKKCGAGWIGGGVEKLLQTSK